MLIFRKLFDCYLQSSIHIAVSVFCMTYVTIISNSLETDFIFPLCVFFGTIVGYNFLKYSFVIKKRELWFKKKIILTFLITFFSGICCFLLFISLQKNFQIQLIFAGLLVAIYPLLRNLGIVKMFMVSLVIAYVTVTIPFNLQIDKFISIEFIKRFLFVSALMIPFEISDSVNDILATNTLPQKFGIQKAKYFGYIFTLLFLGIYLINTESVYIISDVIISILLLVSIYFSSTKRNKYFTSFWVESIPILWLILQLFFNQSSPFQQRFCIWFVTSEFFI